MANYKITGTTLENGSNAPNIIIVYKADRDDLVSIGGELGRSTAGANGIFEVQWADWNKEIFVVAIDPTNATKYNGIIFDWILPETAGYDPYFNSIVSLMHMEGTDGAQVFLDQIDSNVITTVGNVNTSVTQAKYGGSAAYFDGTGDWLVIPDDARFNLGLSNFCIEFWVYMTDVSGYQEFVLKRSLDLGDGYCPFVIMANSATLQIYFGNGTAWMSDTTAGTLTAGQWMHIAVTRDGSIFRAFIDGIETGGFIDASAVEDNSRDILIGCNDNLVYPFEGYIDEFRFTIGQTRYVEDFNPPAAAFYNNVDPFFDKVVSLLHMDGADSGTSFTDVIGHTVTAYGGTTTSITQKKFGATSAKFTSSNSDRLEIANDASFAITDKDFTIEAWVYFNTFTSGTSLIAANRSSSAVYGQFVIYGSSSQTLQVYLRTGTSTWTSDTTAGTIPLQQWCHIAVNKRSGTVRIFINGVQTGGFATSDSIISDSYNINLGVEGNGANDMDGYIDDFRFTVGASRYNSNFAVPIKAFQDS